ncbi:hypothetical protein AA313_de0209379 [Arthrobotrys entomopaga]|nr:hypothetical protein AA313_de0209379 [Arthrobotrys entomopaga]
MPPRRKSDRTSLVPKPQDRVTSTNNNHGNNGSNNTNGGNSDSITLSDAYQGNILLYSFLKTYTPPVLLERNISRVLAAHHAELIKLKDKGVGGVRLRGGNKRRRDGDGDWGDEEYRFKKRKRKWAETIERLLPVPDFNNGPTFGVLPDKLRLIPDAEDKTVITIKLNKPFEIPLSAFAVERDGVDKFADAYEIQLTVSSQDNDDSLELGRLSLVESHKGLLNNPIVGVFTFDGPLNFTSPSEAHMLYRDVENPKPFIAMTIKHAWSGRLNFIDLSDKKNATSRLYKHGIGPSSENSDNSLSPRSRSRRSRDKNLQTAISSPRKSKHTKLVQMEYSFRGSVKNFDDQDQNNRSKFHLNDKTYTFESRGFGYTCIFCQKRAFETLERLRFHLKNTHLLFAFSLTEHKPSKIKDVARIMVDLAVESTSSKLSVHQLNSRKFTWMKPRRSKAFNLSDYLEGDNSWTTARVGLSETERRMMNGPGRVWRRKGIVPKLVKGGSRKRVCVLPVREDGKGFVRFQTGREVHAGDEVSESGDEVDEKWLERKVEERIEGSDISINAKAFMQLWAAHIWAERYFAIVLLYWCFCWDESSGWLIFGVNL